nr:extracellular solute-binding protein [Brachybacterium equifaecis]
MTVTPSRTAPDPLGRARLARRSLFAGGAVLGTAALAGCSSSSGTTLFFHETKSEAFPFFTQAIADFNAQADGITVVHNKTGSLSAAFVRSSPPDVGCLNYNLEMARFMERGALIDLADMEETKRIRPDVQDLVDEYPGFEDRVSVIPYSIMAASTIYNRTLFQEHGLEVPTTWDELLAVCEAFRSAGVTPFYATLADPWTVAQGWFDYAVGGMVDVAEFFRAMNEAGPDVTPDSEVSFSAVMREPVEKMMQLLEYINPDAASRGYGDGNTAMAGGAGAMYLQGPWAFGEIDKVGVPTDMGTFPLPMTENPDDRKVRVNTDLALWIPEASGHHEESKALVRYLMQPDVQHPYNKEQLGFSTTTDAPPAEDPRIAEMQTYYDEGRFYQGPSKFIPLMIPAENYFQAIATGADIGATLAQLDNDWARLAFRQ